ncbi:MAG: response regulator [Clostridiaceae bacterium]
MEEKILIVDDDIDIINLVKDILEDEGYRVDYALNGKDGENKILSNCYDLVLLDIMLPDINGQEIMKDVRDKVNIPIIFLTAKSKKLDKLLGFEIGGDDYITKPFDDMDLLVMLKYQLLLKRWISLSGFQFQIMVMEF